MRLHNPNSKSIVSAIFAQLTAECRRACPGMSFLLIITPSHVGSGSHLTYASLSPESITQTASRSVQPLLHMQMTAECQWDAPSPIKIAPSRGVSGPPSNTWFPGPTGVLNPNGISIGSAVFAAIELTNVTDRHTDRQTTLLGHRRNSRPHL